MGLRSYPSPPQSSPTGPAVSSAEPLLEAQAAQFRMLAQHLQHLGHGRRDRPPLADPHRTVDPHPDQEDHEVAVDICRVTTWPDLHSHSPPGRLHIPISMYQEGRLPPPADPGLPAGYLPQAAGSLFSRCPRKGRTTIGPHTGSGPGLAAAATLRLMSVRWPPVPGRDTPAARPGVTQRDGQHAPTGPTRTRTESARLAAGAIAPVSACGSPDYGRVGRYARIGCTGCQDSPVHLIGWLPDRWA